MPDTRNSENRFSQVPIRDIGRSKIPLNFTHKTTANAGLLVPFMVSEVLPGDTFDVNTHAVVRMTTPIYPVMDNLDIDVYYFYYPWRHMYTHYKELMGENTQARYIPTETYTMPKIKTGTNKTILKGSLLDHLGLPTNVKNQEFIKAPIIMTGAVWNEWFRDQNLQDPVHLNLEETATTYEGKDPYNWTLDELVTDFQTGRMLPPVNKTHDYFSSALVDAQKGTPVSIPIGVEAPVRTGEETGESQNKYAMHFKVADGTWTSGPKSIVVNQGYSGSDYGNLWVGNGVTGQPMQQRLYPSNLWAKLDEAVSANINDLRKAMALQHFLEVDAMSGTRYRELLLSHFGVSAPDSVFEIPEYLGGYRHPINIESIVQTSATNDVSPQGNVAGMSVTGFSEHSFTKGFVEGGLVMGYFCIRIKNETYQNGRNKLWDKTDRYSFYWPEFANLGYVGIKNSELCATGTDRDNEIFGYQEAYSELRYANNLITGRFRSNYAQSLDSWHYGEDYETTPYLSGEWIMADKAPIDRTLAVTSELEDQFIIDIYVENTATRPIPLFSIPGMKGWF